jgi:hypothetical protein
MNLFITQGRTGLQSKFDTFRSRIELTQKQKEQISGSHKHLRNRCLSSLTYVDETFLTGSYIKNTMIRPPDDVDVFVEVKYTRMDSPNTVLNRLKKDLKNHYSSTIKKDRPCVILDFSHCKFELTPFFINYYTLYIPNDSLSGWVSVPHPNDSAKELTAANNKHGGKLVPLIKMMKQCARKNNIACKSYELEQKAIYSLAYFNGFRDGVMQLLRIYDWTHNNYSQLQIQYMTDDQFATFCRNELFGSDFPT